MRFLLKIIILVAVFLAGAITVLNNTDPKDLDITVTKKDLKSAKNKLEKKEIQDELADREMTALLQENKWEYNIIPDSQIRFNKKETVELSGKLYVNRLYGFFKAHKVSPKGVMFILKWIQRVPINPPYYVRTKASIVYNRLTLNLEKVEIGTFSIPPKFLSQNNKNIATFIDREFFPAIPGLNLDSVTIQKGRMSINATLSK